MDRISSWNKFSSCFQAQNRRISLARLNPLNLPLSSSFFLNTVSRNLWRVKIAGQESSCSLVVNNDVPLSNASHLDVVTWTARPSAPFFTRATRPSHFLVSLTPCPYRRRGIPERIRSCKCSSDTWDRFDFSYKISMTRSSEVIFERLYKIPCITSSYRIVRVPTFRNKPADEI